MNKNQVIGIVEDLLDIHVLTEIGWILDSGGRAQATTGGVILPDSPIGCLESSGKENFNVRREEARSEFDHDGATKGASDKPGSAGKSRSAGKPRATRRSSSPHTPAPFVEPSVSESGRRLSRLFEAYPGAEIVDTAGSPWVFVPTRLFPESRPRAYFICELHNERTRMPRAWAFWTDQSWIGPRHTNPPDGSICAFHLEDRTWVPGDSLATLFDLYSLWVAKQLHLKLIGWWPGEQVATGTIERIVEFQPDEWCGCALPKGKYRKCCLSSDLSSITIKDAVKFNLMERRVPNKVLRLLDEALNEESVDECSRSCA